MLEEWSITMNLSMGQSFYSHVNCSSEEMPAYQIEREVRSVSSYILSMLEDWSVYCHISIYGTDSLHDGNCSSEEMPAYQIEEENYRKILI